jgi:hypothetical protein
MFHFVPHAGRPQDDDLFTRNRSNRHGHAVSDIPSTHQPFHPESAFFPCGPSDWTHFEQAKVVFHFKRTLPVSAESLFDIFEDPTSWPKWAQGIGKVVWTSPKPFHVGTTRTVVFWGGMEVYEQFIAWERGQEMAFVFYGTSQEVWRAFGEHYRVEENGDGTCHLTWTVAYDPMGVFAWIHPLIGWLMRLNLGSYLWRLERYCRRQ